MPSFIATILAAAAIVTFAASLCSGLCLLLPRSWRASFSPAARARALLSLCVAPLAIGLLIITASLAPAFGWIADHCLGLGDVHSHEHPHICEHFVDGLPALSLLALAAALLLRVGQRAVGLARALSLSAAVSAQLKKTASVHGELRVLPFDEPQAFVLGYVRPTLFVSRGLLAAEHRPHLAAVLAHERAHVRRADALRSLIATAGLAFHLPWIARALHDRLARAQEMAADFDAARAVGDRSQIARALVHLARAQLQTPRSALAFGAGSSGALAFGASDVELRVRSLLDDRPLRDWPSSGALLLALTVAGAFIALHASTVHHVVEQALGLFGGQG